MKRHSAFTLFASLCVLLAAGAPAQESKAGRAPAGPVKGAETEPSLRAPDATGGPDAFGYTYIDSASVGGPVFNFIDISATGTALGLTDDAEANVTLSFPFPFYGVNQTQVRVGNNGGLLLGTAAGDVDFTNVCPLPSTSGSTAQRISVFWDDIDDDTGNVFHQTFGSCPVTSGGTGQCWIVQWHNRPHFLNTGSATFQAVLYANGNLLFQYLDTDFGNASFNAGASASIGIEDELVNPGYVLSYSCNQANAVPNSRAILWRVQPVAAGASIVSESCTAPNAAIDPGETVTVSLCVENNTATDITALVGTLQATGGVENPSAAQSYGTLLAGGAPVCRNFTFNADLGLTCGATLTATLALQDAATTYPSLTYNFVTGALVSSTLTFSNAASISIPSSGVATPYPSTIAVAGMSGTILDVNVTVSSFDHTFPDDVDMLVVSPAGTAYLVVAAPNGGTDAINLNLTLDDAAAAQLPVSAALSTGTFRPMAEFADSLNAPAPPVTGRAAPTSTATLASMFNGQAPNGNWSLYVQDFASGDLGDISGGWSVQITSGARVCCTGACTVTAPPDVTVPNDLDQCGALASYARPGVAGICGLVTCTPPSGGFFPVGTTTVTCDPEAAGANTTSSVTVNDVQAPVIGACPADIFVDAPPGALSMPVDFTDPGASDNCPGVGVACDPASGSAFPVGTTTDVCTATDAAGNTDGCAFDVTVGTQSIQEIPTASALGLAALALLLAGAAFLALRRGA